MQADNGISPPPQPPDIADRLGAGDRALECLEILTRSCTACNLLTYHNDWRKQGLTLHWGEAYPPFQMDANFGLTAAVIEMLLFSKPGLIKLLPALPTKWPTGQINGLKYVNMGTLGLLKKGRLRGMGILPMPLFQQPQRPVIRTRPS